MTDSQYFQPAHLPLTVSSAPGHIWLDLGFDPVVEDVHFSTLHDLTWSADNASGYGIKYIRADLATPPELLEIVRISIGNIRSLGPAGALAQVYTPYREWLAQLEAAYANATGAQA